MTSSLATLYRFRSWFGSEWKSLTLATCAVVPLGLLQLPGPLLTMSLIDAANHKHLGITHILAVCAALTACLLLSLCLKAFQGYLLEKYRYKINSSIQRKVLSHTLQLPLSFHLCRPHGYLMARVSDDPYQLVAAVGSSAISLLSDLVTLAFGVGFLLWMNWRLALIAAVFLPGLALLFIRVRTGLKHELRQLQEKLAVVQLVLADALGNLLAIKLLSLEKEAMRRFVHTLFQSVRQRFTIWRKRSMYESSVQGLVGLVPIIILAYGSSEIASGRLSVGQFIACTAFLAYLYRPAEGIVLSLLALQTSLAAADRIHEILSAPTELADVTRLGETRPTPIGKPEILSYEDVYFRYGQHSEWIVEGANFAVGRGEIVAVVGPSGCGKTTLVNLIPRLLDASAGKIIVNGIDNHRYPLPDLRKVIALVSQENRLFSTTILHNIRCSDPHASMDLVEEAAKLACAEEFICRLAQGFNTEVGEKGQMLSAGQLQRVLIARAIVRKPLVLILDEATAFLDQNTTDALLENLRHVMKSGAVIVVTHRRTLLSAVDRVLLVNEGRVVEEPPTQNRRAKFLMPAASSVSRRVLVN